MAKFKYKQPIGNFMEFDNTPEFTIRKKATEAVWTDEESGVKITVEGKNFVGSEESEYLLGGGKIHSVVITDGTNETVLKISDLDIKATKVMAGFETDGIPGIIYAVTLGDDRVIGNDNSDDYLVGGAGDDVLTGGKGQDYFEFHANTGINRAAGAAAEHDVITDFDWKGEDADSLQYLGDFTLKAFNKGEDTRIIWDYDGSTTVLEGVTKAQFKLWLDAQPALV